MLQKNKMTNPMQLKEGRNYAVQVSGISSIMDYAYVGMDNESHVFTRPGSIRKEQRMRIIEVRPNQIIEVREQGVTIENYLLHTCDMEEDKDKFDRLNKIWEESLK